MTGIEASAPPRVAPRQAEPVPSEPLDRVILATFDTSSCDFASIDGLDVEPECGWLSTPLLGSNADVNIQLPVVIFRATGENPAPDPIFYLHGGPGGGTVESIAGQYDTIVAPFVAERDVVLFDQRGSGIAKPSLICEPAQNFWSDPNQDDDVEYITRRAKTCAWRIKNHGVVLTEFNKNRSSDDVMVLARELGYDSINLIGTSWGGILATTIMTREPDLVRSAVLNSPLSYHTDLSGSMPASYLEAIGALQLACDGTDACEQRFGDIAARFAALVDELDKNPLDLTLTGEPSWGGDAYEFDVELTGEQLVHLVFGLLYSPEAIASIPDLILDLEARDPRLATRMASIYGWGWGFDFGFLTYMCTDVVPASSLEAVAAQQTGVAVFDRIDDVPDGRGHTAQGICNAMKVTPPGPQSPHTAPTAPALVLSGALDPITPYSSGVVLADSMPNGRFVGFDDLSHGALHDECASTIAVAFLAAPDEQFDTSCADKRSPFVVADAALSIHEPNTGSEVIAAETTIAGQTVSLLVPANYTEDQRDGGTVWWRDDAPYDLTAFAVFVSGEEGTAQEQVDIWFDGMAAFETEPDSVLSGGSHEWDRYEVLSPFGVALTSIVRDDGEIALMLQAYPEEIAQLEWFLEKSAGELGVFA